MRITKTLLGSAAIMALSLGYASEAKAFDDVNWTWNKDVTSIENITIDVVDEFDISGLVEIEKNQINIGDVTATSTVSGINNNPPGGTSDGSFSGIVNLDIDYETDGTGEYAPANVTSSVGGDITSATVDEDSTHLIVNTAVDPDLESDNILLTIEGQIDLEESGINEAVDLPSVESVATAVANNQSIDSTVALNLHDGQYNMGDVGIDEGLSDFSQFPVGEVAEFLVSTDNTSNDILAIATIGSALGLIQQGEVSATSSVSDILNASVDSSATAVGNNLSVDLAANTEGDAFALADLTQFNFANVSASSTVTGVDVNNYANLGVLEGPLVNSVATAIGNNVSFSVSSPEVPSVE